MSGRKSSFTILSNCLFCNDTIVDRIERKYCNRSCSAKSNGTLFPKRRKGILSNTCTVCGNSFTPVRADRSRCDGCLHYRKTIDTISKKNSTEQAIRGHARRVMGNQDRVCFICKYDVYVEVCHIQAIKSFSPETSLQEINSKNNLVFLCPNHHKELDLGLIEILCQAIEIRTRNLMAPDHVE